jgi:hypothetical protein
MISKPGLSMSIGLSLLTISGAASADVLVPISGNSNISGNEVISSGTFNGVNQGWFTSATGGNNQLEQTVNGQPSTGTLPLNVLNLAPNSSSTYNLGDNFKPGQGSVAAGDTIKIGLNQQAYGFVDTYVLNLPTGTASNFDVSFAVCLGGCTGVSNLTARLYEYTAGNAQNSNNVGSVGAPAGGLSTVVAPWTVTQGSGMADYTQFQNAPIAGGEYVLQVAGLTQTGGGSFSGVLNVTAVPLPASLPLLLGGLLGLGTWARHRV